LSTLIFCGNVIKIIKKAKPASVKTMAGNVVPVAQRIDLPAMACAPIVQWTEQSRPKG